MPVGVQRARKVPGPAMWRTRMHRNESDIDSFIDVPANQTFIANHFDRMLVFAPYWDSRSSWFPRGLVYVDAYALYTDTDAATVAANPSWVLKDGVGNNLYIPFGCSGGVCPQYAGDFGNAGFRQFILDRIAGKLSGGTYSGIFIDDVNMDFRVSDGNANFVAPTDPRTGLAMTETNWRVYMAGLCQLIRATYSQREIAHNALYWAGGASADAEPSIKAQIESATYINIERWVSDSGITAGTGQFGWQTLMAYCERRHLSGVQIICSSFPDTTAVEAEYALASYWMIANGGDLIQSGYQSAPDGWWAGWDLQLGVPTSGRYQWNGLWRRDYTAGMVLVREPTLSSTTVTLPGTYTTVAGSQVTEVTLAGAQGAVLRL